MGISAIKDTLNEKVDAELMTLEQSTPVSKRDEFYFSELEIKTAFRNALYNAPIADNIAKFIIVKGDVLQYMYEFFAEKNYFRQHSDTMQCSVYHATISYLEKAECGYLAGKLYQRVTDEYAAYIDGVKKMLPDEIIKEAFKLTSVYELMCCLHPEKEALNTNRLKRLLSVDGPLLSLYEQWLQRDYSYENAMVDVIQTAADSVDIDIEDGHYAADPDLLGRNDLLSDDEYGQEP